MLILAPAIAPPCPVELHKLLLRNRVDFEAVLSPPTQMDRNAFASESFRFRRHQSSDGDRITQSNAEMLRTMKRVRARPRPFYSSGPSSGDGADTVHSASPGRRAAYATPPRARARLPFSFPGPAAAARAAPGSQCSMPFGEDLRMATPTGAASALAAKARTAPAQSAHASQSPCAPDLPPARPSTARSVSYLSPRCPVPASQQSRGQAGGAIAAHHHARTQAAVEAAAAAAAASQTSLSSAVSARSGACASLQGSQASVRIAASTRRVGARGHTASTCSSGSSGSGSAGGGSGLPGQRGGAREAALLPAPGKRDGMWAFAHSRQQRQPAPRRPREHAECVEAAAAAAAESPKKRQRVVSAARALRVAGSPSRATPTTTYNARSRARDDAGKRASTESYWGCDAGEWAALGTRFENVAASPDAVRALRADLGSDADAVATLVWSDLTTSFFAPEVHRKFFWYNHARAVRDLYPGRPFVTALLFLAPGPPGRGPRPAFIPLALCEGEDLEAVDVGDEAAAEAARALASHGSVDAGDGYRLPFRCCLGPAARWRLAMEVLLRVDRRRCVVYNAQQLLLPFVQLAHVRGIAYAWRELAVVDLRLAHWMASPDADEKALRWEEMVSALAGTAEEGAVLGGVAAPRLDPMNCVASCADAAEGALLSLGVLARRWERLQRVLGERGLLRPLLALEAPVAGVLVEMEHTGTAFDPQPLMRGHEAIEARLVDVQAEADRALGGHINLSSPEQVAKALYETLRLAPPRVDVAAHGSRKAASRHRTTSEAALLALAREHPLPALVLEHRKLVKVRSTYCEGLLKEAGAAAGLTLDGISARPAAAPPLLLHCWWNQCNTGTGRLSSSHPNLQNIPRPGEHAGAAAWAINVRDAFVASRPETTLLAIDYSQIEMRVLAHWSGDEPLSRVFAQGGDVYVQVAAILFGRDRAAVGPDERKRAKVVTLGVMYGMGPQDMGRKLGVPTKQASDLRARLLARFPGVRRFVDFCRTHAQRTGHVRTLVGRQRWLPDIKSAVLGKRLYAERQAVNTVIQGSAADIFKACILRVHALLARPEWTRLGAAAPRLLLQVHDEVVIEAPRHPPALRALAAAVKREMEAGVHQDLLCAGAGEVAPGSALRVPLLVTVKAGDRWGTLRDVHL